MTDDALPEVATTSNGTARESSAPEELREDPRQPLAESPKVLVVDNEHYIRMLAKAAMEQSGFEVVTAGDGKEALEVFEATRPDIVLLDMSMPVMDGFTACAKLRELPHGKHVPILIMTGFDDFDSIKQAYEIGATDFVVKPINWMILNHRIEYMLRASRVAEQNRFLAYYDTLTELPNRHAFTRQLERALSSSRGAGSGVGILFLDLDRFKRINDSLSHTTGDSLLREVAKRLLDEESTMTDGPDRGFIARLGSDEFGVLLTGVSDRRDAAQAARQLVDSFTEPFELDGQEFFLTASIGLATHPEDGEDADSLLRNADTAMYRTKAQGGNGFRAYTQSMNDKALEGLVFENKLGKALERGELELFYQPQFDLLSRRPVGVEALIRWRHPELGILSPDTFIPVAETTGLIREIGDWVLETACHQAVRWSRAGRPPLRMAVNLSSLQFLQKDFPRRLAHVLKDTGMPSGLLELELTESTLMHDGEETARSLEALKAMGVRLAIDDFGTGYSSLSYLMRFPLDVLKIDRSFLRGVPLESEHVAITSAILAMAKSLRLQVIAEGVESEEQVRFLAEKGCDVMQGFLLAKPAPADVTERLLWSDQKHVKPAANASSRRHQSSLEPRYSSQAAEVAL